MKQKKTLKKSLQVLKDNVLIETLETKYQTKSGLINPEQYDEKAHYGKVIGIGEEVKRVSEGDLVYFNKYSWTPFPYGEKEFGVLKEEDILAVER